MDPIPEPIPLATVMRASEAGEKRSEPGADLTGWSLAAAGSARTDGECRSHDLYEDGAQSHATRVVVNRSDRRVSAVSLGLGRDREDQDRSREGARARDEWNRPRSREVGGRRTTSLADGQWNSVARKYLEEDVRR